MRASSALTPVALCAACTSVAGLDDLEFGSGGGAAGAGGGATSSQSVGGSPGTGGSGGIANGGDVVWVKTFGGDQTTQLGGLGVRSDDGVVVALDFSAAIALDDFLLSATDGRDAVLAVMDGETGAFAESTRFPGMGPQAFSGLAVGNADELYVCMTFQNDFVFSETVLVSANSWDVGMAVLEDTSRVRWAESYGGNAGQDCHDIGFADGQLIVKGALDSASSFGGATFDSQGSVDGWMGAYDLSNGQHQWSLGFGSAAPAIPERPLDTGRIDVAGEQVALAGGFNDAVDFGGGTLTSVGGIEGFVSLHLTTGEVVRSLTISGQGAQWARDVAIVGGDGFVVVGDFENAMTIADTTENASEGVDGFVARVDGGGNVTWLYPITGAGRQSAQRVALGPEGQIYVAGVYESQIDGVPTALTASNEADIFVYRFSPEGSLQWARSIGGNGDLQMRELVVDNAGHLIVGGHFPSALLLDDELIGGVSEQQTIFVAKLTP